MTAAALARYTNRQRCRITLVESKEIGTVGVGEATIPPLRTYHRSLGLDEDRLIRAAGATIKLGIEFVDWYRLGNHYLHPFGLFGREIDGVGFHQAFFRLAQEQRAADLWRYSPCAVAGRSGRFGTPSRPLTMAGEAFPFAYHLDARLYALHLRDYAERHGVERVEGKITGTSFRNNGFVEWLKTADDRIIAGNLFIDCSGSPGVLINRAMGVAYVDWTSYLPCNRAVVAPSRNLEPSPLLTRSTARTAGWQWRIQLQHRTGNGYVYSSAHSSNDSAQQLLLDSLGTAILESPRVLSFTTGRRNVFWERNVIAIGLSAGFLEPLESTSIHLIQIGIAKLLELFPDQFCNPVLINEYNRHMAYVFESVRDFIVLHYKATVRDDSSFWRDVGGMSIPDSLRTTIELFRESGRFIRDQHEVFSRESWVAVMLGQGIFPRTYNALVDSIDSSRLANHAARIEKEIQESVDTMPLHDDYLQSRCLQN